MTKKMKRDRKILVITTILCLLPIVFSLTVYDRLPEEVAVHWNMEGEANGYASKEFAVFGLPLFLAFINIIVNISTEADPKRKNTSDKVKLILKFLVPIMSLLLNPITILIALGKEISVGSIVSILVGVLFIVIGNYMPKCKQNYTIGIRIPWTLCDEDNWNRTHHMAGYLYIIGGILFLLTPFFPVFVNFAIAYIIIFMVFAPYVYSYILYRKSMKH